MSEIKDNNKEEIVVSVLMISYMHSPYIIQAITGVLDQKCNFRIELIIGDDNSPDDTERVVNNFLANHPKKHVVRYTKHKENKGMHANGQWVSDQARGKYIAICEGDDYWTDPFKLQKQVDFLEHNPDYGLVYTKARIYEDSTQTFLRVTTGTSIHKKGILYGNPVCTLTTVFRSELNRLCLEEIKDIKQKWPMGDYQRWIWFYYNSKIHFMNEVTAVYRKLENSASNFTDSKKKMDFRRSSLGIQMFYGKKYLNDSEYLELSNHLKEKFYYSSLLINPNNSRQYYNEIVSDESYLKLITKMKLYFLEKLNFKFVYLSWINFKTILKKLIYDY